MQISLSALAVHLPEGKLLFRLKSLRIAPGERLLIEGPSGVGKTTLLHLIAGLFMPSEGQVQWDDQKTQELTENRRCHIRRESFGIIFQNLNLLDHLTGLENVMLAVRRSPDAAALALKALEQMKVLEFSGRLAAHCSLGEQQRIAVARALVGQPKVVLADEPTSSLDQANADAVLNGLLGMASKPTVIAVSHDSRLRARFDRVIPFGDLIEP